MSTCKYGDKLTLRELDVAYLIAQGKHNKEIGKELFICEGTVRNHISSIFIKKGYSSRLQIAIEFLYVLNEGKGI
jgi:DNA-binding NarL/FixJ family response regulator